MWKWRRIHHASVWEYKYAQWAWDYTKAIVFELVNGAKPFQLASPMQWKHVIFTARVSRCFHCVENIWSFFRGTTLWSIWIECNDLVFNTVRWDGCRIHKAIWDALLIMVGLPKDGVSKKKNQSLTSEQKILENFNKGCGRSHVICVREEGMFIR
jgi:hypothetical protein